MRTSISVGDSTLNMISPVAIGTTATRLPAGNPSRANHSPCSLIFGNVFCRKESPAISIFKLRAFICYPCFGRAARANGLPLVSYPFQLAWHGHFVFALERAFRFHAGTIPKQFRFSRKIFKNLCADSKRFTGKCFRSSRLFLDSASRRRQMKIRRGKCCAGGSVLRSETRLSRNAARGVRQCDRTRARNASDTTCENAVQTSRGFVLYAFCMLSEHRFGKVGKSQEAHKSAHCEKARNSSSLVKQRENEEFEIVVNKAFMAYCMFCDCFLCNKLAQISARKRKTTGERSAT